MVSSIDIRHRENFNCKEPQKNIKKAKNKKETSCNHTNWNAQCPLCRKTARWTRVRWWYHGWKTYMFSYSNSYQDKVKESIKKTHKQIESQKEFESKVELKKASIKEQKILNLKYKNKEQGKLGFNELKNNCVQDAIIKAYHIL